MVKKLLLLVLVGSMICAGGEDDKKMSGKVKPDDSAEKAVQARYKRNLEELRRKVGDAGSSLEAYRRLMNANKSPGMSGSDVLGAGLSVIIGALLVALI